MPPYKPKLGQNFLSSLSARQRIVDSLGDISDSTVVEIGSGHGAITDLLIPRAKQLIAIELDDALAPRLTERYASVGNVRVLHGNILHVNLRELTARPAAAQRFVVVGNLPYYITADILLALFAQAEHVSRAVLMVQDEVADRLAARPGTSNYGVLSATAQMHARVEKLFTLPPEAFSPPPKVHSAAVRLAMQPRFDELQVERASFLRFIQGCFQQKRKMLANNLRASGFSQGQLNAAIEAAGLPMTIRAEGVPLEAMARLYRSLRSIA